MKRSLVAALALLGCSSDDGEGQDATTLTTTVSTTAETGTSLETSAEESVEASNEDSDSLGDDTGCTPGTAGCPCMNGMCLDPLVCVDNECSWPPPTTDSDPTTDPTDATTGEPPPSCESHDDCNDTLSPSFVCTSAGNCEPAVLQNYLVRVNTWNPATCDGGTFDGDADLWWGLVLDGELRTASGFVQGGCPGAWDHEFCVEGGGVGQGFAASFRLNLYDEDNTASELHDTLWFDFDDDGAIDLIPTPLLINGEYSGPTNFGGQVDVEFIFDGC